MSYQKSALRYLIADGHVAQDDRPLIEQRSRDWHASQRNGVHHLSFSVSLQKAHFVTGGALVTHTYQGHNIEFLIPNSFILKEFDLLKPFFIKSLGKKRINVKASVTSREGKVVDSQASSADLDRIATDSRYGGAVSKVNYTDANSRLYPREDYSSGTASLFTGKR